MSELHNRLAHLVNYSSQLIFVSGDTVADQQRTLSDFLSSQQENTEISFITAEPNKLATDYRSAICRQLGGHTVGSFVRPLKQLLTDLSADSDPYLVCITAADHLEPAFLQELWDWVMQSQQTHQNIHLNIILFGKADWAESSQEWLPSQNSHRPVLLSSQSVNSSGFDVNALEALMANERTWFNFSSGPVVTNKWFIGVILSLFFVIFVGLLSWQYPNQINQLLTLGEFEEAKLPAFDIQENATPNAIINPQKLVDDSIENTTTMRYTTQLEVIENESNPSLTNISVQSDSISTASSEFSFGNEESKEKESVSQSILVRSWQQANTTLVNSASERKNIENGDPQGDFQVPDIISIEQLDEQLTNSLHTQLTNDLLAVTSSDQPSDQDINSQLADKGVTISSINSSSITELTNNTRLNTIVSKSSIDYRFDETTLLSLPTDGILLQLSGIQNPVVLENYLATNNLKEMTWVYETQRYGGSWYVVLYRESFESIDAALKLMSSLPEDVQNAGPFAKSVNQIQQEIRQR